MHDLFLVDNTILLLKHNKAGLSLIISSELAQISKKYLNVAKSSKFNIKVLLMPVSVN